MKRIILLAATLLLPFGALATSASESGVALAERAAVDSSAPRLASGDAFRAGGKLASSGLVVERQGERIHVHAQSEVDAGPETVWATLSDYDELAAFIPDMVSSRTVSRAGARAVVEQKGTAGVGLFRQGFSVLLEVVEQPHDSISLTGIGGDFRRFDARYDIVRLGPHRTRIVYEATLVPDLPVPPLVGMPVMRSMIGSQFDALVREMKRRGGSA
jgi:carbon monoxide dehydrogenase subunit G